MSVIAWFSSKIRFVCLIQNQGATRYRDSVYIFRALDYDDAFREALRIAKEKEEQYKNEAGMDVQWWAKEVISLDRIGDSLQGEVEVYSEPVALEKNVVISFGTRFQPEASRPTQTV